MAYVAVNKQEDEFDNVHYVEMIWSSEFKAIKYEWGYQYNHTMIELPNGSIQKLIGRQLTWDDEPVYLIEGVQK